ncbi:MAG: 16S rRNA (uracil(1498)-N(3))-methyltransferase [Steroidobacteraceae bacterium]
MRLTRVHLSAALQPGAVLPLPDTAARHVARVLRLAAGDALRVFDGAGHEFEAVIASVQRGQVQLRIGAAVANHGESPLAITLLQGVARGEKMDFILQKATELGVTRIVPLLMARSTVKLDDSGIAKRQAHWQAVLASACEQCGRARLPVLTPATALGAALAGEAREGDLRLLLAPQAGSPSLPALLGRHATTASDGIQLLVGPEGGFDDAELAQALAAGYLRCRLGPRVLRTETAGLAAIAALQALAGDWR